MPVRTPRIPYGLVRTKRVSYRGGLNTEDPQHDMPPGELVEVKNYEVRTRQGYRTFNGYERFDGQPQPSAATFYTLDFNTGTEEIAVGATVTGLTSSATGIVVYAGQVESGSYVGGDAAGYLILDQVSGTFQTSESLQVSAATKAVAAGTASVGEAETQTLYDTFLQAAIEYRRDQIAAVPGDGAVRGVNFFEGTLYAFRDDSGTAKMYKSSASGWTEVDLGSSLQFYDGNGVSIAEGFTVTGASSSATATVRRLAVYDGTFAAGTARGALTVSGVAGAFQADEALDISFTNAATADGTQSGSDLNFDSGGTAEILVGHTVTGAASGATGVISAVDLNTGSWDEGTAKGTLTFTSITGTFTDDEALDVSVSSNATAVEADSANTLGAAGKYEFVNHNFLGTSDGYRMYGCNGTGLAFEFDGTYMAMIRTGPEESDYPSHIQRHTDYLLLGYRNGIVKCSSLGTPLIYNASTGAAEFGVGDQVTGMVPATGNTTVIYSRNNTHLLSGQTSGAFTLQSQDDGAGAQEWSAQAVGVPWSFDDRGITAVSATDAFGNFLHSTLSEKIQEIIEDKSGTVTCSMRVRAKSQYRVFFSDKTGLTLTFWRGKVLGIIPFTILHQANCTTSEEDTDGTERLFFGADDGYVYEMGKGSSFDGQVRECYAVLTHHNYGLPGYRKQFKVAHIDIRSEGASSVQVGALYDYEEPNVPQQDPTEDTVYGSGGKWDISDWNEFSWGSPRIGQYRRRLGHSGETCALVFYSSSIYDADYTLEGHTMHFNVRNRIR